RQIRINGFGLCRAFRLTKENRESFACEDPNHETCLLRIGHDTGWPRLFSRRAFENAERVLGLAASRRCRPPAQPVTIGSCDTAQLPRTRVLSIPSSDRFDVPRLVSSAWADATVKPLKRLTHSVQWALYWRGAQEVTRMSFICSDNYAASRALLCGSLLILSGCGGSKAASPAPPPPTVEVATVIQRDTPIYSDWIATLDGYVNAEIQPPVSRYLVKQNFTERTLVRTGDVVFEIDPRPCNAALDQAKAQLAEAEAQLGRATLDVERDTPLAAARAIAQRQLDTELQAKLGAQAGVLAAKAAVEQAELN